MRYQRTKKALALIMTGIFTVTVPISVYGSETEADIETELKIETESEMDLDKKPEDFVLQWEDKDIVVKNEAVVVQDVKLEESEAESGISDDAESENPDGLEKFWNLELIEQDGTVHFFEDIEADQWKEPELINKFEWLFIRYQDEDGNNREIAEKAEETEYEKPIAVWVMTDVNVRKEASSDSEIVCVGTLGSELEALGIASGWVKVKSDDSEGYIFHRYLTEDEKEAEEAVVAENNARAAAEAAAAAAQAQAQAAAARNQSGKSSGKKVVSKQAYDDCDGSGHGYYEIVYSDGSVVYQDY